jgi:Tol biopolymer transport system component
MVDSDKPDERRQEGPLRNIDPKIEEKVDKMMMPDSDKPKKSKPGPQTVKIPLSENDSQTAPLLPGEKLPDFDKPAPEKIPARESKPASVPEEANQQKTPVSPIEDEQPDKPNPMIESSATNKAVDDIVEKESDRILAMEDAKAQLLAEGLAEIDRGFFNRLKSGLSGFWHNTWARSITLLLVFAAIAGAAVYPASRYYILNAFGVRASLSLRVIDEKTDQPLKNVTVSIDNSSGETDKDGNISLNEVRLGEQELSVKKQAFADFKRHITVGWGSNPIGDVAITPVGSRYKFEVKDYVSGRPVANAEAVSGEASASANAKGEIILVVADQNESEVKMKITAPGYRDKTVTLEVGDKDTHSVNLVPAKKHAFVSKRSGTYDLYKIDVDGRNEKMILAGTGSETENTTVILPSPDSDLIAYVATRGDHHSSDGTVDSNLMVINLSDDQVTDVDYSQSLQLLGFVGSKLVYVKIDETQKDDSAKRQQLISYDTGTQQSQVLDKANYFNDALVADGVVYYAPAKYADNAKTGFYRINPDGSAKITIYDKEVWNLLRIAYDKLDVSVEQNWYQYGLADGSFNALNGAPSDQQTRIYTASPDGEKSAWVDERDGKGVLLIYDTASGQDSVLHTQSGLANPISWLDNDHLIYRVSNSTETADYAVSLHGGQPKKIRDVTNTAGLDRWYYY